jgi:HPr kinase/phosphorylase
VAWEGRAVVIAGASGTGKSALALTLMAFGCSLIADDRVQLTVQDQKVIAQAPTTIAGLIEARGIGILRATMSANAQVALWVDLDRIETERLPPFRRFTHLGCDLPLIYRVDAPHFAPAILQILKSGWSDK